MEVPAATAPAPFIDPDTGKEYTVDTPSSFGVVEEADLPIEFRQKVVAAKGDVPQHIDFFDVQEKAIFYFPDKVQYVELKVFSEGDRRNYQNQTNREARMNTTTRELKVQNAIGDDRHALLALGIIGWYVLRNGQTLNFDKATLNKALDAWPPTLIDMIEKHLRKINPWMQGGEETIEAIEEEISELQSRLQQIKDRTAKN